MNRKKFLVLIATLMIAILGGVYSQEIYANSFVDGEVAIDETFTSGDLGTVVESIQSDLATITSLAITEGVVNANDFAWIKGNLSNLEELEISGNSRVHSTSDTPVDTPDNIVPDNALSDMESITGITIPSAIEIGASAFKDCHALASISLPEVEIVGESAFEGDFGLNSVSLPAATILEDKAFYKCTFLRDISLPKVIEVGNSAFYGWNELASISFPEATTIGDSAFYISNNLRDVSLPKVTSIGSRAFYDCPLLESISLPNVEEIGSEAFCVDNNHSSSLKELTLGALPRSIASNAFNDISSDSPTVTVPNGNASAYLADDTDGDSTDDKWYGWTIYELSNDATLSDLVIKSQTPDQNFDFGFASNITEYSIDVTHDTYRVYVTPTVNHGKATIEVNGESIQPGYSGGVILDVGENEIDIKVTAEDGSWANTVVTVTREGNNVATLSDLGISEGTLDPAFATDTNTYTASVANEIDSIEVTPTATDSNATIKVALDDEENEVNSGEAATVTLDPGINEIKIIVTAEDGSSTAETVIAVTRASDAKLSDLSISEGTLSPTFDSDVTNYDVEVNNNVEVLRVTPTVSDNNATVTVNGTEVTNGAVDIELSLGTNEISIVITAVDGSTSETTLTVTRAISLTIDETTTSGSLGALIATKVEGDNLRIIKSLTITEGVVNADDFKWLRENLKNLEELEIINNATVDSGTDSSVDINSADNTVPTYIVGYQVLEHLRELTISSATAVEREAFVESNLESVVLPSVVTIGESAFEWCGNLKSISLPSVTTLGNSVLYQCLQLESVSLPKVTTIGREAFSSSSSLKELTLGATVPNIEELAFDSISTDSPTLRVPSGSASSYLADEADGDSSDNLWYGWTVEEINDGASNDATLSDLSISGGTLNPVFNSSITSYTVNVTNSVTSIEVTPTVNSSNATLTVDGVEGISGTPREVSLSGGANVINILVTAEDGVTTIETIITVTRADSSNSNNSSDSSNYSYSYSSSKDDNNAKANNDELIIEKLADQESEGIIEVSVEDNETISENVFEALSEEGGKLIIDGDWYQWEFDGQLELEEGANAEFEPSIEVINSEEVDIDLEADTGFILKTKYEGKLPIKAKLKLNVNEFAKEDQTVYLYYYNETTGKLELSGTAVNENGLAEFEITHCSIYTVTEKPAFKADYEEIAYVSGYSNGAFLPNKSLTRAEAAVMLSRLLEVKGIQGESQLSDIDMWANNEIKVLSELNIINGYSDYTFKPNNDITRGELAAIMAKVLGLDTNVNKDGFTDTEDHWAEKEIIALRDLGVINGYDDGSFKPDNKVSRVEAIAMINGAFGRKGDTNKVYDNPFSDIDDNHWAFYLIMNAAGQ